MGESARAAGRARHQVMTQGTGARADVEHQLSWAHGSVRHEAGSPLLTKRMLATLRKAESAHQVIFRQAPAEMLSAG